jgi:hypothetical protein
MHPDDKQLKVSRATPFVAMALAVVAVARAVAITAAG